MSFGCGFGLDYFNATISLEILPSPQDHIPSHSNALWRGHRVTITFENRPWAIQQLIQDWSPHESDTV